MTRLDIHTATASKADAISRIIHAYDDPIIKAYCWARFKIMRQRFLDEIGQYLPVAGRILDVGCGFGLFSLYFAQKHPGLEITGIDINPSRVRMAQRTAEKLSLENVHYEIGDATSFTLPAAFDGAYMLDIVHHVPRRAVRPLFKRLHAHLEPGSRLIIKDVAARPAYKRWFTYALDKLIDPHTQVNYWEVDDLLELLVGLDYEVFYHSMPDILPYPHMLYICRRTT